MIIRICSRLLLPLQLFNFGLTFLRLELLVQFFQLLVGDEGYLRGSLIAGGCDRDRNRIALAVRLRRFLLRRLGWWLIGRLDGLGSTQVLPDDHCIKQIGLAIGAIRFERLLFYVLVLHTHYGLGHGSRLDLNLTNRRLMLLPRCILVLVLFLDCILILRQRIDQNFDVHVSFQVSLQVLIIRLIRLLLTCLIVFNLVTIFNELGAAAS